MARVIRRGLHLRIAGAIDDDAGGDEGEQHGCQEPVAGRVRRPFGVETPFKSVAVIIDVEIGFLHWLVHDASFASKAMEQRAAALPWQQRSHAKAPRWPVKLS